MTDRTLHEPAVQVMTSVLSEQLIKVMADVREHAGTRGQYCCTVDVHPGVISPADVQVERYADAFDGVQSFRAVMQLSAELNGAADSDRRAQIAASARHFRQPVYR